MYVVVSSAGVSRIAYDLTVPWMFRLLNRVSNNASMRCNVDTGRLRSSIRVEQSGLNGRVGSDVEYALFVHEGTRPHVISARPGPGRRTAWRYLAFPGRGGGMVFRRSVNHPGYGGNPFLRDALAEEMARL